MLTHLNTESSKPNRVILLGGRSFVASALIKKFEDENINYLALSRPEFDFTKDDIQIKLDNILKKEDALIYLATLSPNATMNATDFYSNMLMIKNIVAVVQDKKPQHFIYMSSDAVYCSNDKIINELSVTNPSNLYGAMHLAREQILKMLSIPFIIVRPTQIYGMDANHNAYGPVRMCRSSIKEQKIQIFGFGEELRDFVAIQDVVNLLMLIVKYKSVGILNIATGNSVTFQTLANEIAQLTNSIIENLPRTTAIWHRQFDIGELKKAFPTFQFSDIHKNLPQFLHAARKYI